MKNIFSTCCSMLCSKGRKGMVNSKQEKSNKKVFLRTTTTTKRHLMAPSAIRVVSSVYMRLLISLPEILIPACASSSPAFLMMYSAQKWNKQGDNIQPWCIPFPIWNQSVVPCPVLTVASWPAYRFLKRQVRWSGIPISWRIFQFVVTPPLWQKAKRN